MVKRCVLLTVAYAVLASATPLLQRDSDEEFRNNSSAGVNHRMPKIVYYKHARTTNKTIKSAARANDERLSKMSSLNPKFWVYSKLSNPEVKSEWNMKSDCFYKSRKTVRKYPTVPGVTESCYLKDFNPPRWSAWWNFWPEIRGDLQFAFDFVMWDEYEQYHETNSFWYLMLYLKTLLQHVRDPHMVAHSQRPMFDSRRSDNQSMFLASLYPDKHIPRFEEHQSLRDLLVEYEEKLSHLESLVKHL